MTFDAKTAMQLRNAGIRPENLPPGTLVGGRPIERASEPIIQLEVCPNGTVRLVIPGPPPGKPRMSQRDKWRKRPEVQRYREWCDRVREAIGSSIPPAESVTQLNWMAYFEPPASWPKKKRVAAIGQRHRSKPDSSNILKGLEDCLWPEGDEALSDGRYSKRWDWVARLEVEITVDTPQSNGRGLA